jgi:hypothetical protein
MKLEARSYARVPLEERYYLIDQRMVSLVEQYLYFEHLLARQARSELG